MTHTNRPKKKPRSKSASSAYEYTCRRAISSKITLQTWSQKKSFKTQLCKRLLNVMTSFWIWCLKCSSRKTTEKYNSFGIFLKITRYLKYKTAGYDQHIFRFPILAKDESVFLILCLFIIFSSFSSLEIFLIFGQKTSQFGWKRLF